MDPTLAPTPAPAFPTRSELALHQELHARPALPARANCVVSYWALAGMSEARAEQALQALCLSVDSLPPPPGTRHHVLHAPGFVLKFERHGEFVSWQVNRPLATTEGEPDDDTLRQLVQDSSALPVLPDAFVGQLSAEGSGRMLAAAHVVLLKGQAATDLLERCQTLLAAQAGPAGSDDAAPLMGAWIGDARRGALLTHLRLGRDGFTRFIVLDFGLPPDQAAREAQRLCEIEAYRMLAMLGFPVAQEEAAQLAELERNLQGAVDAMANDSPADDAEAFDALTRLAAGVEHGTARTRYRFSATRAYHALVERRLADLREQRIDGVQTLAGFLSRRFAPAMALCNSIDARLTDLGERIHRATSLARVRIESRREQGNQDLLRALAQRQKQQLQLQQTVEGLSVVAISYYVLGLVGYLAKAAGAWPVLAGLKPELVVGAAVLPVVLGVAWFLRRLHPHG
jgi:uncharacterized membrane-anchored protein